MDPPQLPARVGADLGLGIGYWLLVIGYWSLVIG
jgi:hypothetical protein